MRIFGKRAEYFKKELLRANCKERLIAEFTINMENYIEKNSHRVERQSARKSKTKTGRLASLSSNRLVTVPILELWTKTG